MTLLLGLPNGGIAGLIQDVYPEYGFDIFVFIPVPQVVCRYGACREGNDRCRRDWDSAFAHCNDGVSRIFR
jgi:hypothetical protein